MVLDASASLRNKSQLVEFACMVYISNGRILQNVLFLPSSCFNLIFVNSLTIALPVIVKFLGD